MQKHAEALVVNSKNTGLEVNAVKTKYMVMTRAQNAGRSHNVNIDNSSFERVEQFKYLETTLMNKNTIQIEIKSRLKSRKVFYHSVQNLLSSNFLFKYMRIKINRTMILNVVLYGCETWSLTLRERSGLRVSENKMLRRIFRPKRDGVTGEPRKLHNKELTDLCASPNIIRLIKSRIIR
jgi:hypothetical protein